MAGFKFFTGFGAGVPDILICAPTYERHCAALVQIELAHALSWLYWPFVWHLMPTSGDRNSGLPSFYVVPYGGHWSAPRMLAALAGVVHHRQSAYGDKHNRDEDNY